MTEESDSDLTVLADRTTAGEAYNSDTDVLIVGAGPAGLTLALLLAGRGRTVAVYERWGATFPLPRAAAMSHETVRTFQSAGLLEQLRPLLDFDGSKVSTSLFTADGERLGTMNFTGEGASGFPAMVGFHQPDVDGLLGAMCEAHPLVGLHRGWDARAVEQGDADAVVTLDPVDGDQPRDGDAVRARARYVVGCDGANSVVRSLMRTGVTDTGFSSSWLVVDTLLRPGATPLDLFGHVLDPERPATLAPAGTNRQRFEFMIVDGDDPARIADPDSVWRLIGRWGATPEKVELARSAIYTFRGRWAGTWRDGRVLLAGDAAHQMPPFLGQGFNSGVRDTVALAWRLDLVLGGGAEPELLDSYTTERLPHVRQIIETSVVVGQLLCSTDAAVTEQRIAEFRAMREGDGTTMTQSEWRLGPGCLMPDDPAAGFTARQGRVEKDGRLALLDDLAGAGRFVLFGNGVDPLAGLSDQARAVWRQLGGIGVTIGPDGVGPEGVGPEGIGPEGIGADGFRDVDGAYAEWFENLGATVVLVRPDFQVYGASTDAAYADQMVRTLDGQLHARSLTPTLVG